MHYGTRELAWATASVCILFSNQVIVIPVLLTLVRGLLQRSMDLASFRLSLLHHVSHQSHSWGRDLMGTWWIMLLGRSWSRLDRLLGS